ncbi:MAG: acyltransferase family protein [Bifidobacteriaceae bacterium]|nr:acyltransferase family protein [Bifidobacteriaceae bacterium]
MSSVSTESDLQQAVSQQKTRKRAGYIDVARGIAIILVVVHHTGNLWKPFDLFYTLFFMPLFMFISGFVSSENKISDFKSLILHLKKRIPKLYFFYLKWELIYLLLTNFFLKIGFYSTEVVYTDKKVSPITSFSVLFKKVAETIFLMGREPACGAFWFIVSLIFIIFGYSVINFAVNAVFAGRDEHFKQTAVGIAAFACFIIGCIMNKTVNIPRVSPAFTMMICYHLGYLSRAYKEKIRFDNVFVALFSFIALCILGRFGSLGMNHNNFPNGFFFLAASFTGIYFSIFVSKLLEKTFVSGWLEYVGRNTLPIVAMQFVAFKSITLIKYGLGYAEYADIANLNGVNCKNWSYFAYVVAGVCIPLLLDKAYKISLGKALSRLNPRSF